MNSFFHLSIASSEIKATVWPYGREEKWMPQEPESQDPQKYGSTRMQEYIHEVAALRYSPSPVSGYLVLDLALYFTEHSSLAP